MVQMLRNQIEVVYGKNVFIQNLDRLEEAILVAEQLAKFSSTEQDRYKFTLKII